MSILVPKDCQKSTEPSESHSNVNLLYFSSSKFSSYANLLNDESRTSSNLDPVIVNDNDPEDTESNISLSFRQPSYISLSDMVITKGGDVIRDSSSLLTISAENLINLENMDDTKESSNDLSEQNPVIVFDSIQCLSNSNDESNLPIKLNVRQPSYISLGPLEFIPKGSTSLSDFHPKIEKSVPRQSEFIEEEDEKRQNPEIQFIQKLNSKNLSKWRKIGYEPPENLIPNITDAFLHTIETSNQSSAPHFSEINTNCSNSNFFNTSINVFNSKNSKLKGNGELNDNSHLNINCGIMRRSSSFGMEVGEAESKGIEMMNEIMGSTQQFCETIAEGDDFADDEFEIHDNFFNI